MDRTTSHGGDIREASRALGANPSQVVDFSANLNPLGPPEQVWDAVTRSIQSVLYYPEPYARQLRRRLAHFLDVPADSVAVTAGASEALERAASAALGPARARLGATCRRSHATGHGGAVIPMPSYAGYPRAVLATGALILPVAQSESWRELAEAIDSALAGLGWQEPSAVFLGNPNNPDGRLLRREEVLALARRLVERQTWLIVDESFMPFVEDPGSDSPTYSVVRDAARSEPEGSMLIVVGSLTKIFSFPGFRVGYAVGSPELIHHLDAHRDPWTVGSLAQTAAAAAIEAPGFIARTHAWLSETRPRLVARLSILPGVRIHPPSANFVLLDFSGAGLGAGEVARRIAPDRVWIRDASNFPGLGAGHVRVAVRTEKENDRLLRALARAVGQV